MGTSTSSNGPGPRVPFDPPWLDEIDPLQPSNDPFEPSPDIPSKPFEVAPSRRFANSRRALGVFARSGSKEALRKAIGHYSSTGMGGARNVANRMRTSAKVGAVAINFLQAVREKSNLDINKWIDSLTKRNASLEEIAEEIGNQIILGGGSIEEASSQLSMALALEDLLNKNPEIDLLSLNDYNIWLLVESFLCNEAFNRLCFDIGQVFEDSTISPFDQVIRLKEMRAYLKTEMSVQLNKLRVNTSNSTSGNLTSILEDALKNTFTVFEEGI